MSQRLIEYKSKKFPNTTIFGVAYETDEGYEFCPMTINDIDANYIAFIIVDSLSKEVVEFLEEGKVIYLWNTVI